MTPGLEPVEGRVQALLHGVRAANVVQEDPVGEWQFVRRDSRRGQATQRGDPWGQRLRQRLVGVVGDRYDVGGANAEQEAPVGPGGFAQPGPVRAVGIQNAARSFQTLRAVFARICRSRPTDQLRRYSKSQRTRASICSSDFVSPRRPFTWASPVMPGSTL
jgi:hypothetical protein